MCQAIKVKFQKVHSDKFDYNPISFSKLITGEDQLAVTQTRDKLKTEYAANNGFRLLRIRFDDNIIEKLLANI